MRDIPLPFELEGKGGVGFLHKICRDFSQEINGGGGCVGFGVGDWSKLEACFGVSGGPGVDLGAVCEPTSVLETKRSPSPCSASTSSLSSSFAGGGCGSTDTAGVATVSGNPPEKWPQGHPQNHHQETSNTHSTENSGNNSSNNVEATGGGMAKKDEWVNLDLFQQIPTNLNIGAGGVSGGGVEKCGLGGGGELEYWDNGLLESASPGQDQSILRLIMGDMEDPSVGLSKLLQGSGAGLPNLDFQFGAGGLVDQGFGLEQVGAGVASATAAGNNLVSNTGNFSLLVPTSNNNNKGGGTMVNEPISPVPNPPMLGNLRLPSNLPPNPIFASSFNSGFPVSLQHPPQNPNSQMFDCPDEKSHVLNHPQLLISQLQAQNTQNPAFLLSLPHNQLDQHLPLPPPAKRHNAGIPGEPNIQIPKSVFSGSGQLPLVSCPQQLHVLPYMQHQHRPAMVGKPKMTGDEMMIQQQAMVDQLHKAVELVEAGNPILAQEILARLNHQLSPIGKPFYRIAFYFKEALRLLLMNDTLSNTGSTTASPHSSLSASPFNLIFKIGAYKSFAEISPLVQFANFTCNQAVLEALEGFDQIRIVDFDVGYGGQWSSVMQELALRKGGAPSVKITAFASPSTHDQLELGLTRENLIHFAQEINMSLEFEIINLDYLNSTSSWSLPFHVAEGEAIAVNLPVSSLCNSPVSPTIILRLLKQLSPKIVVSVDRGCDRNDLTFANHFYQSFQSYLALLESLDVVNPNLDALQKIETYIIRPGIEKLILGRHASPGKIQHWKTLFLSAGFSPVNFSNFTECQAEWLLKRTLARGFHVEKRQSSLVLCWQRKELISASAWRCQG